MIEGLRDRLQNRLKDAFKYPKERNVRDVTIPTHYDTPGDNFNIVILPQTLTVSFSGEYVEWEWSEEAHFIYVRNGQVLKRENVHQPDDDDPNEPGLIYPRYRLCTVFPTPALTAAYYPPSP
jgi:hypothetical protein